MAKKVGVMTAMEGQLRSICNAANEQGIQREDIIALFPNGSGKFTLVYYKYE